MKDNRFQELAMDVALKASADLIGRGWEDGAAFTTGFSTTSTTIEDVQKAMAAAQAAMPPASDHVVRIRMHRKTMDSLLAAGHATSSDFFGPTIFGIRLDFDRDLDPGVIVEEMRDGTEVRHYPDGRAIRGPSLAFTLRELERGGIRAVASAFGLPPRLLEGSANYGSALLDAATGVPLAREGK